MTVQIGAKDKAKKKRPSGCGAKPTLYLSMYEPKRPTGSAAKARSNAQQKEVRAYGEH